MFGDVAHVEPGGKIIDVSGNVRLEGQSTRARRHRRDSHRRADLRRSRRDREHQERRAHRIRRAYVDRPRTRRQFERAHHAPRIESQWPLPTLSVFALFALALQSGQSTAAAAPAKQQQIISLDAQSSELDLRTNNVIFRKVRIAQGNMSVSADQGQATRQASGLNFDNSLWVFRGNVKITMDQGQLTRRRGANQLRQEAARQSGGPRQAGRVRTAHREDRQDRSRARRHDRLRRAPRASCGCRKMRGSATGKMRFAASRSSTTCSRKASSQTPPSRVRSACTSSSRRRRPPNHERAAGAEPRQKLQVTAGAQGFVARGRERRGGGPAGSERRRQDHRLLHDRRPHALRARRDLPRQSRHRPSAHAPAGSARARVPAAGALGVPPPVGVEQHHGHPRDASGSRRGAAHRAAERAARRSCISSTSATAWA